MKQLFAALLAVLLLTTGATAIAELENTSNPDAEIRSTDEMRVMAATGARERTKSARCGLEVKVSGEREESTAAVRCSDGHIEHTDDWIAARLAAASDNERAPGNIALVNNVERCPGDRVCYRMTGGTIDVTVVNDPPTARSPLYEDDGNSGENPFYTSDAVVVVGYGDFSISKRSARTGRNPQTGKEIQIPADESDRAIANRLLSSVKSSQCPEDGRDRCIVEAVKGSEMYADLAAQGDIEILMTLTADPLAAPKEGSGDCDDTDPGIRPDRCRTSYPVDLDGDGLDDLAVEGVSGDYTWTIDGEVVGNATVHISRAAGEQVVFMQVGTLGGETSRAELVEAIASHSGLSKADSKKALDGFIDTTAKASVSDCCFDYNKRTETSGDEIKSPVSSKEIDKATPKLAEEVARKDARIAELEARIAELEADGEVNTSAKASEDQGNDRVVRKKPGRAESGNDMDSDGDGLGDGSEEDVAPSRDRRPGFVNNLLRSIFG